uniref:Zmp:0000001329 n=1 Tax=Cyclopterus lumpus TaxID=8103 RepID=A0A8C2WWB2_CYCLU
RQAVLVRCSTSITTFVSSVFLNRPAAARVLGPSSRRRRANSFSLEEMLPGDLERECHEEVCSQEEAAEIFQTREKTVRRTAVVHPCLNGGLCSLDRGDFLCLCPPPYHGRTCLLSDPYINCRYRNGGCMQYCRDLQGGAAVQCGCADGFRLEEDGQSCSQKEGVTGRIVGGVLEKPGGSPWQVLVCRSDGYGFCGGTLVSDRWVVSAAHCLEQTADHVTIGDHMCESRRPDPGEQVIKVQKVFVHPHFHSFTFDSDIALLYLARPVVRSPTAVPACLPDPHLSRYLVQVTFFKTLMVFSLHGEGQSSSRFLRKVTLPVISYRDCIASTEQVITDNMFCAGYLDVGMDACSGDSGGPFVVNYRGTWFLTGVVSWGEQCAQRGKYGVYARLGNFLNWIKDTMERPDLNSTES